MRRAKPDQRLHVILRLLPRMPVPQHPCFYRSRVSQPLCDRRTRISPVFPPYTRVSYSTGHRLGQCYVSTGQPIGQCYVSTGKPIGQ
eukprot:331968-Rhodomonas_salina.1